MLRRIVQANDRTYLFAPDDPPPLGARTWALVKLRVIDELDGEPPDSIVTIQAKEKRLTTRVTSDGIAGLVGIPQQVFPRLRTNSSTIHLTVSADGYLPLHTKADFAADPTFPATFTPPPLINLALHREPVVIAGRTMRVNGSATIPANGATIGVTGIWRRPPHANVVVPPDPANLVALRPPLYSDRVALTQFMRRRDLALVAGSDKKLVNDILPGTNPILLSDRQGLSAGDVLLVDAGEPDLAEFIAITNVPVTNPADQPTPITLAYPVSRAHRRQAVVQQVTPQPPGAQQHFAEEAIAGDSCVFLDGLAALAGAREVEINGLPGPDEHHTLMRFSVTSDADGYYRLPPLSRVAQLEIHAEKIIGAQTFQVTTTFRPDYRQRENLLNLTLRV